jgi:quercetin dioxygenase-like cupin family protein
MRLIELGPARGRPVDAFGSEGLTIAPLTEPLATGAAVQAACFRLGPGGRIGRHPASVRQLLAVVEGAGWVSGADGKRRPLAAGEAVCWDAGEGHETGTETGLTAIVLEGPGVRPRA